MSGQYQPPRIDRDCVLEEIIEVDEVSGEARLTGQQSLC